MQGCNKKGQGSLGIKSVKEGKDNKKRFFNTKRKTRENVDLLLTAVGALVTEDTEKLEILNSFFALVFTIKTVSLESQTRG